MTLTFNMIARIIADTAHVPLEIVKENSSFQDDLGIDSLQLVNLFIQMSEITGIGFDRFLLAEDMKTAGGIFQAISKGDSL